MTSEQEVINVHILNFVQCSSYPIESYVHRSSPNSSTLSSPSRIYIREKEANVCAACAQPSVALCGGIRVHVTRKSKMTSSRLTRRLHELDRTESRPFSLTLDTRLIGLTSQTTLPRRGLGVACAKLRIYCCKPSSTFFSDSRARAKVVKYTTRPSHPIASPHVRAWADGRPARYIVTRDNATG